MLSLHFVYYTNPGDPVDGECKQEVCSNTTKPDCNIPANQCLTNTTQCLNDVWGCVEANITCDDGFTCESFSIILSPLYCSVKVYQITIDNTFINKGNATNGICQPDKTEECALEDKPVCTTPQDLCITNSSECSNKTWICVEAIKECPVGQYCKSCYSYKN